jgi:fermentation-respiration switch protein FrsA (DUF1100 family)
MIGISIVLTLAKPAVARLLLGKPWPAAWGLAKEALLSTAITLVITLVICLILTWTGFTESQFYRPSTRDYGQHTKLKLTPEDLFFKSKDGTRLHGWFIPAKDKAIGTVIHLHGSDRNITHTLGNSHWLTGHGFNLYVFDYRGYGRSAGQPTRQGVVEDAVAAIDYVRLRPDVDADRILLWGQSMGGQLAIVAADRAGQEGIQAVVADATYASHKHHVKDKLAQMGPLWLVQWAIWFVTSDAHAARGVVGRLTPTRILLVHGTADTVVQPYHSNWLFQAAGEPKALWRVPSFGHLKVFQDSRYREKLVQFFREALGLQE